jgi:hypothetical protein
MKNTTKNWIRSLAGLQQLCTARINGEWCKNKALFGVGMYQGRHMVVCSEHYQKAKELLEEGHGTQ